MPSITFIGPVVREVFLKFHTSGRQNMMLEHVETKTNTHIQRMQWYNYMNPKRLVNGLRGDQTTLKISYEACCEKTGLRDFRPGQTKNGLYSYRSWLVA